METSGFRIRPGRLEDQAAAYYVCLKTGDHGADGEAYYQQDRDALGRIFVGPYLAFEPDFSLILEDDLGVCGYALAALDSRSFYDRYEREWRPDLCNKTPKPTGDPRSWSRVQTVYSWYHQPNYFCPEPYSQYPSHMHIDLLLRARAVGLGRRMMEMLMQKLQSSGSPGTHLGVSVRNSSAMGFYQALGFRELIRVGGTVDGTVYLGKRFDQDRIQVSV